MSELADIIRGIIAAEGPISIERYMDLALGHPEHGYYMNRDPLGADGDFITAPEISQMFGEMICVWCADYWMRMGAPKKIQLVELGPGRGTLMRDLLRAARAVPTFFAAIEVNLVDMSPVLRDKQRGNLAQSGRPAAWRDSFEDTPRGPLLVIANEFFDALPARHYVKTRVGWRERVVGLQLQGKLSYGAGLRVERSLTVDAPDGSIIELNIAAQRMMAEIAARVAADGGAALAIDYGYAKTCLGETLQAVRAHEYVDPLAEPGEADLTTHVDFAALSRAARSAGARVHGPVSQSQFLMSLGIRERAQALSKNAGAERAEAVKSELERLISQNDGNTSNSPRDIGMGGLFKAMAVAQNGAPAPVGFQDAPISA